jgi:hypothetical protein
VFQTPSPGPRQPRETPREPGKVMRCVATLVLAVVASAGCDSGPMAGSANDAAAGPVSAATFPEVFADTYCGAIADCCRRAGYSSTACHATAVQILTAAIPYNAQQGFVLDETTARRCLDAYAAALRACTDHALAVQIGVDCYGLFATYSGGLPPRTNDALAHARLGEACGGSCVGDNLTSSTCSTAGLAAACWIEDGVYCADGTCVALPTVGQACSPASGFSSCGVDARCVNGTCVGSVPTGGTCGRSDDCLSADYCSMDSFTCVPVLANGSACREDRDCAGARCDAGICRTWSMATGAACAGQFD